MESDEQQIQRLMEEWHQRTARGELDAILGLMTEDAVFLGCGFPPMSKAEFAAGFRKWAGRARIESRFTVKDMHASGDVAYVWSYISIVMTATETGRSTTREGHVLSIFASHPPASGVLPETRTSSKRGNRTELQPRCSTREPVWFSTFVTAVY
jgi:uncharacterized protein (TIGR02246 family)